MAAGYACKSLLLLLLLMPCSLVLHHIAYAMLLLRHAVFTPCWFLRHAILHSVVLLTQLFRKLASNKGH